MCSVRISNNDIGSNGELRVLHVAGCDDDPFKFKLSYLWAVNCPRHEKDVTIADVAIHVPGKKWYLLPHAVFQETLGENGVATVLKAAETAGVLLGNAEFGPLSMGRFVAEVESRNYNLVVPHLFDLKGMTIYRGLFEDLLDINHVGPTWNCNLLCQDKVLTREILKSVVGVKIPEGQVVRATKTFPSEGEVELLIKDYVTLPLPFVVKPAAEDNSRGVSLVRTFEELKPAIQKAFSFGGTVCLLEEFIPGREIRCGIIEEEGGSLRALQSKIEYVMINPDYPIRREEDKFVTSTDESGKLVYVPSSINPAKLDFKIDSALETAAKAAHRALGCRDYSLFDFRVHAETSEIYVIEACTFWSFTPISVISKMMESANEDFKETSIQVWRRAAFRGKDATDGTQKLL